MKTSYIFFGYSFNKDIFNIFFTDRAQGAVSISINALQTLKISFLSAFLFARLHIVTSSSVDGSCSEENTCKSGFIMETLHNFVPWALFKNNY